MGQDRKSNYSGPQPPLAPPATSLRTRLLPALRGPLMRPGDKSTLAVLLCCAVLVLDKYTERQVEWSAPVAAASPTPRLGPPSLL